jgi:transposase InsO family protein
LALVQRTHERSRWPIRRILAALAVPRAVYYAWRDRATTDRLADTPPQAPRTAQLLPNEREAIVTYAQAHPTLGYRRLAWSMVDAEIAAASPSAVYDVLRRAGTVYRPPREDETLRRPPAATRPDQRWHLDVLYLWVFGRWYFLVTVIDAYSRYVVAWDLCWHLTDDTMALVLRQALDHTPGAHPEIVTDNGPEFVGRDFLLACKAESLTHIRTRVHHPQSNGTLERYHRTFRAEGWAGPQPADYPAARALITEWVQTYNTVRLHSALQYLTPWDYYRGDPAPRLATRRTRLQEARLRRREAWEAYYAAAATSAA